MLDIKTMSQFVEEQFPSYFIEEGDVLVSFVKAYYEFLEETDKYSTKVSRQMFDANDIDDSLDEFVRYFKSKYLKDFPFVGSTTQEFAIKHIMDYYRSKGSPRALELLMRLLYNVDVSIYYPSKDIFKSSESKWNIPRYIEVDNAERLNSYLNTQITGSKSQAKAFVEGYVKKRINGKYVNIVFISSIEGTFVKDDLITNDGNLASAPKVLGSLSEININIGGARYSVGDVLNLSSTKGQGGKVRVVAVSDATGQINFELIDGGFGFTLDDITEVYISDAVILGNNSTEGFLLDEYVYQPIETLNLLSSTDINQNASVGDYLIGVDSSNNSIANGVIVEISNTDSNGNVVTTNTSYTEVSLYVTEGSFNDSISIDFTEDSGLLDEELITEESDITLQINEPGAFANGEVVEMFQREGVSNSVINYAFGTVSDVSNTEIVLTEAWGNFVVGEEITGANSGVSKTITSVDIVLAGATGKVTSITDANTVTASVYSGSFNDGKKVRGNTSKSINEISSTGIAGAVEVWLTGNSSANGVIDLVSNNYVDGTVIGQNTGAVGVFGNTSNFFTGLNLLTDRASMVSPPRYANGDIIQYSMSITELGTGSGANFEIGSLENEENITINTDFINGSNIVGQPYGNIRLDGSNSGIGFVDSIDIIDGGSGYSNGTFTFEGGGFSGSDPIINAEGTILTDGSGEITSITITNPGEGYAETPTFDLGSFSSEANVEVVMDFGYGFPAAPQHDIEDNLFDTLEYISTTIGEISRLSSINPGENYNVDQFVRVINKPVASLNRRDIVISVANVEGTFILGESVEQSVNATSTAKGSIVSFNSSEIVLKRESFGVGFLDGIPLEGTVSGATADIVSISSDPNSRPMGDNADIGSTVQSSNGIVSEVQVIDSGYGYITGENVTLRSQDSEFVVSGNTEAELQGLGSGFWTTTDSHPSFNKRLQDGNYYQEFSYDILSGLSLNKYKDIVKNVFHPAGMKMFGSVRKENLIDLGSQVSESEMTIT